MAAASAGSASQLGRASSDASSRVIHREQAMLLLKHIISGDEIVRRDSDSYAALGIQDRDPRKDYEWSNADVVGSGGFATVYRGVRRTEPLRPAVRTLGREVSGDTVAPKGTESVAIKICRRLERQPREERFKLWREVAMMRMLAKSKRCNQLLPLFDAYMWKDSLYLVMPLCAGGKFETKGMWFESDAACVAAQIAKALHHMHKLGCVHNDIKPSNLLLLDDCSPPRIVVADYGESLIANDDGEERKAEFATIIYAPPEWMGGLHEYSRATDIYSLGVTVSFLLTGRPPFDANDLYDEYQRDPQAALRRPGSVVALDEKRGGMPLLPSDEARDFVRSCCKFNPEDRPTAKQVLAHPWIAKFGHGTVADEKMLEFAGQIKRSLRQLDIDTAVKKAIRHSGADADVAEARREVAAVVPTIPVEALRSRFHELVPEGQEMNPQQFSELMCSIDCDSLPLGRLFNVFDTDSSNGISFKELVEGLGVMQRVDLHSRVRLVFELYDSDGDGKLSPADIQEALGSVITEYTANPVFKASVAKLTALMQELVDKDGNVSREVLAEAVSSNRELLRLFLSPADQAKEVEKQRQQARWVKAVFGTWTDSIVHNPFRSAYVLLTAVVFVVLVLHLFGVIDLDAYSSNAWSALDTLFDSPGAVDGPGDTVGDMDYVLSSDSSMLKDID